MSPMDKPKHHTPVVGEYVHLYLFNHPELSQAMGRVLDYSKGKDGVESVRLHDTVLGNIRINIPPNARWECWTQDEYDNWMQSEDYDKNAEYDDSDEEGGDDDDE